MVARKPNTEDVVVFVVDDERENVELARRALGSKYTVVEFTDPKEALAKATELNPSALIVDYRMPGMTGLELVREVRKRGLLPAVIITTAFPEIDELLYAEQLKLLFRIVPKPWEPQQLGEVLDLALADMLYKRALQAMRV